MAKYNLNGNNVENLLVIDNTASGISIGSGTIYNFPNKYKAKIGSSIYSYTNINYLINNIDQGTLLSPKIKVFITVGSQTHTLTSGTKKILCICLGGGAGGTGGNQMSGGESGGGGGGGGGGGLAWIVYKVNGGETLTIVVGNGGNGGANDTPVGIPGTDGNSSSVTINGIKICEGYGGIKGEKSTGNFSNNNAPGTSGPAVSGTTVTNSTDANVIEWGVREGLVGGNGQFDPDKGDANADYGLGGAGGNGGTTEYFYGKGVGNTSYSINTIPPLKFNDVIFFNSNSNMDPTQTFTNSDFNGTNSVNYGKGGSGGLGEGRNNGTAQPGNAGKSGFVIIVEYGII